MSRYSFSAIFLFLLIVCYSTCKLTYAHRTMQPRSADVFVAHETKLPKNYHNQTSRFFVESFYDPVILNLYAMIVVISKAAYEDPNIVGIVARTFYTEGLDAMMVPLFTKGSIWNNRLVLREPNTRKDLPGVIERFAAVSKSSQLHVLTTHRDYLNGSSYFFKMAIGFVSQKGTYKGRVRFLFWDDFSYRKVTKRFKRVTGLEPYGLHANGLLAGDGTIIFVVDAVNSEGKYIPVILHSLGPDTASDFAPSYIGAVDECSSFFIWEGKLMKITDCQGNIQKVMESTNYGKNWTDAVGPISRLWDNLHGKQHFTNAVIGNSNVLLYTMFKRSRATYSGTKETYLWVTDGNRVHNAGLIYSGDPSIVPQGLTYINDDLFSLHHNWMAPTRTFITEANEGLKRIKSALHAWKKADGTVLRMCGGSAAASTSCTTDGLVGFLSNSTNGDATDWHDEYLFANAAVRGGRKVAGGFKFSGAGAGAKWTVVTRGEDVVYNFSRHGLTVVATVTIDGLPEDDTPLLTVGDDDGNDNRAGLWYGKDKKWKLVYKGSDVVTSTADWEAGKSYRVVLVLYNSTIAAHVKLEETMFDFQHTLADGKQLPEMLHVLLGGYDDDDEGRSGPATTASHVTVTNVLLYNRQLNDVAAMDEEAVDMEELKSTFGETEVRSETQNEVTRVSEYLGEDVKPTNIAKYEEEVGQLNQLESARNEGDT